MAVRNADGGFFLCVSMQNVYKKSPSVASKKVTIQWLSEAPDNNPHKDIYVPEYYDKTGERALCCETIIKRRIQIENLFS